MLLLCAFLAEWTTVIVLPTRTCSGVESHFTLKLHEIQLTYDPKHSCGVGR